VLLVWKKEMGETVKEDDYTLTVEEMRERLSKITITAKTEEGQAEADELLARVLAEISDSDIEAELAKQQETQNND